MTGWDGWTFLHAGWLWLALLAVVAVLGLGSWFVSTRELPAGKRAVLLCLRLLALALAAVAVVRPAREVEITRARRAPLLLLLDDSESMLRGSGGLGRAALDWLQQYGPELEQLQRFYRTELVGLGDPPLPLGPDGVDAALFARQETPLGRTLEALTRLRPDCEGLVLLSDGRDTERPGAPPQGLPFPVYPVTFSGQSPPDLWVESVQTPPVGFIRTPVEVRVRVGVSGLPGGEAVVTLLEGASPVLTERVAVGPDGGEAVLVFTPTRTGRKAFRVEVTPWPEEVSAENNRAQFALNVIRDKTRILLVAGTPTWDVRFLRRRLRQDPGIDLITFLILRTPQDLSTVPQDELSLIPFPTKELFSDELPSFDAVIFVNFDFAPYVPRHYLENLANFVVEAGGGFAMLGGDRSFALGGYAGSPLERILPVDFSGAGPGRAYLPGSFRPRLTEDGQEHPILRWADGREANQTLWNALPELEGMNWFLRPKPGAVVLTENPEERNEYGPMPLIVLGEYGAGRSMVVGTDSLWHWALPTVGAGGKDTAYRDFWTRALRWLVHDPEMELVRLAVPPAPLRAGARVALRARVLDRAYGPAQGAELSGLLRGEIGEAIPLRWTEVSPGEYATPPVLLPAEGLWYVEAEGNLDGTFLGRDELQFPVEASSPEPLRLGVDGDYLRRLAEESGGQVFPNGSEGLFDLLADRGRASVEVVGRRVEEVWATPALLLLTALLFGLDWGLRRFWE